MSADVPSSVLLHLIQRYSYRRCKTSNVDVSECIRLPTLVNLGINLLDKSEICSI